MKKYIASLVVGLILLMGSGTRAEEAKDIPPRLVAETFLTAVGHGDVDAAVDTLTVGTFMTGKQKQLATAREQIKAIPGLYGKYLASEFIKQQDVGASITNLVYVTKYEQHFISWSFTFYKPGRRWILDSFRWSDTAEGLGI